MSGFVVTFEVLTLSDLKTFSIQFSLLNNDRSVKFLTTIIITELMIKSAKSFPWRCFHLSDFAME